MEIVIQINTEDFGIEVLKPDYERVKLPHDLGTIKKHGAIVFSVTETIKSNPDCTCYLNIDLGDGTILRIPYPC